jgi:hypothetical protein
MMVSEVLWVSLFYRALTLTGSGLLLIIVVLACHDLQPCHAGAGGQREILEKTRMRRILSGVWIFLCLAVSARLLFFGADAPGFLGSFWEVSRQLFSDEQRVPAFSHMC